MIVKDLLDAGGDNVEGLQIMVRENGGGSWIHGYRISENERLYPAVTRIENQEAFPWISKKDYGFNCPIPKGSELRVYEAMRDNLPIDILCVSPRKAPKQVLMLEVKHFIPRNLPTVHGDKLFNNKFELEIDCYPPEHIEKLAVFKEVAEINEQLEGQMCLEDFMKE